MMINTMRQDFPGSIVWAAKWAWWINGVKGEMEPSIAYRQVKDLFELPRVAADAKSVHIDFEDMMSRVVAAGPSLQNAVGASTTLSDDRTIIDFAIPRLKQQHAVGGGGRLPRLANAKRFHVPLGPEGSRTRREPDAAFLRHRSR